jgi:hypothetical protein
MIILFQRLDLEMFLQRLFKFIYTYIHCIISDKSVFPFYPDREAHGFEEVLERYRFITPGVEMSGPTSFAPLIDKAIEIVSRNHSVHTYFFYFFYFFFKVSYPCYNN